jgi:hypothetical protein
MKKVFLSKVIFAVVVCVVCVQALEFKHNVVLPPVDGSVFNGSVWVIK